MGKWVVRPRGRPKVIRASPRLPASRPAPALPPAAWVPSRTWRSVIQKRTLGSMPAAAPLHRDARPVRGLLVLLPFLGPSWWLERPPPPGHGRRRSREARPAPARAPCPQSPARARAAPCHRAPAPRALRARCFRPRGPACPRLGVLVCRRPGGRAPGVPAPGARRASRFSVYSPFRASRSHASTPNPFAPTVPMTPALP